MLPSRARMEFFIIIKFGETGVKNASLFPMGLVQMLETTWTLQDAKGLLSGSVTCRQIPGSN